MSASSPITVLYYYSNPRHGVFFEVTDLLSPYPGLIIVDGVPYSLTSQHQVSLSLSNGPHTFSCNGDVLTGTVLGTFFTPFTPASVPVQTLFNGYNYSTAIAGAGSTVATTNGPALILECMGIMGLGFVVVTVGRRLRRGF